MNFGCWMKFGCWMYFCTVCFPMIGFIQFTKTELCRNLYRKYYSCWILLAACWHAAANNLYFFFFKQCGSIAAIVGRNHSNRATYCCDFFINYSNSNNRATYCCGFFTKSQRPTFFILKKPIATILFRFRSNMLLYYCG